MTTQKPTTMQKPSKDDKARDLAKDLATCDAATEGPWGACGPLPRSRREKRSLASKEFIEIEQAGDFGTPPLAIVNRYPVGNGVILADGAERDARFISEAREGWPAAIRRAVAAEAELKRLKLAMRAPAKPEPKPQPKPPAKQHRTAKAKPATKKPAPSGAKVKKSA